MLTEIYSIKSYRSDQKILVVNKQNAEHPNIFRFVVFFFCLGKTQTLKTAIQLQVLQ